MGAITRTLANNITTGGVILPSGINNTSISNVTSLPAGVGGKVLQIVQDVNSTSTEIPTTNTYSTTNLSASITPISTSSKILVLAQFAGFVRMDTTSTGEVTVGLFKDSTNIYECRNITRTADNASTYYAPTFFSMNFMHSPSSTSSLTYSAKAKCDSAVHSFFINRDDTSSSLILMEIKG